MDAQSKEELSEYAKTEVKDLGGDEFQKVIPLYYINTI
jgi:hypothetical protein